MFDDLENRRLLSTVSLDAGKIRITGTSGNDSVQIARFSKTQGQVIDSGVVKLTFQLNQVSGISFSGRAGNDLITIGRVNIKSYLDGGSGNDSLSCSQGAANDTILGGDGSDYLYGGDGNDSLTGGAFDDTMLGGAGNDTLIPLSSIGNDDLISGGDGKDKVDGSAYPIKVTWFVGVQNPDGLQVNDAIFGDVESVYGSAFNDKITVYSGNSIYLDGKAGNDVLTTNRGNDTVVGGSGNDTINTGAGIDVIQANDSEADTLVDALGNDTINKDSIDLLTGTFTTP